MHIHTCLSFHELSLGSIHCPFTDCLLHVYTFPHMWHPCWISPLPLQHKKSWELWNTDPMPSIANVHEKATLQNRFYSVLPETGQKAGKSAPSLSNIPQNYKEDNNSPLTQLPQFWFFARKFFPWCYFFSEVSSGWVAQLLSGRTPEQAAPAFCLLTLAPLVAVPGPLLLFFFLPWPNTITGWRLIPWSTQTDLVLRAKLLQKRCVLGGCQVGTSVAVLGQYHLPSAKMPHPMRFSLQERLKLTVQWSLLKSIYSFTVILCECCQLNESTPKTSPKAQKCNTMNQNYWCLREICVTVWATLAVSHTCLNISCKSCLICIVCTNRLG